MATDRTPMSVEQPGATRRALWRLVRRQAVYLLVTLAVMALAALLLSTVATAVQAGRNEARTVDLVIVVAPAVPGQPLIDHAFELYRRGWAPRMMLVGPGGEGLRAVLQERGVADGAIVVGGAAGSETAQLRAAAAAARAEGAASAVVAGEPAAMLRWLKLAGDEGLRSYGAPLPELEPGLLELAEAGVNYWRYVLFGG